MLFRSVGAGLVCAAFASLTVTAFAAGDVRLTAEQRKAAGIQVERVAGHGGALPLTQLLQGFAVLPPQAIETVSAPVSGFVQSVLVAPTDRLRAGQVVAQMHSGELMQWQREYIQLESQAQQAQDRLQRSERLLADGIVAESRVRDDRYANNQAQIAVRERRQSLQLAGMDEARLRALSDKPAVQAQLGVRSAREGTVIEVMASAGQRVDAGAPLLKIARSGLLGLELQATPTQSQALQAGATVKVAGCPQPGRVRGIAPLMRGGNQAVTVHVDMPSGSSCLRANQAVEAEIALPPTAHAGPSVPVSALFQHGGRDHVFVLEGEVFRAVAVQVQSRGAQNAQLVADLKAGSTIAIQGITTLKAAWLGMGEDSRDPGNPSATPASKP